MFLYFRGEGFKFKIIVDENNDFSITGFGRTVLKHTSVWNLFQVLCCEPVSELYTCCPPNCFLTTNRNKNSWIKKEEEEEN